MANKKRQGSKRNYNAKLKLKKGDEVVIITGVEKGKRGKIDFINRKKMTVRIPGLNLVKKHRRSQSEQRKPEIVEIPAPIKISNVMYWDSKAKKGSRIGYKFIDGKKVRFSKASGDVITEKKDAKIKEK